MIIANLFQTRAFCTEFDCLFAFGIRAGRGENGFSFVSGNLNCTCSYARSGTVDQNAIFRRIADPIQQLKGRQKCFRNSASVAQLNLPCNRLITCKISELLLYYLALSCKTFRRDSGQSKRGRVF